LSIPVNEGGTEMGYIEIKDRKPTEQAEYFLNRAADKAINGVLNKNGLNAADTADVLFCLAAGMQAIAVGLRATYMLLEKK
jgi:hypothetical protein